MHRGKCGKGMEPKISVIMLTYNREGLVGRAIESVICQTFSNFEYIIVDNGSTDNSGKIADDYASKDSRIYVIHREKGSIGSGRNTGLDAVKGEYIAFVDDDDELKPDYLEFLYGLAFENNAQVAICGVDGKNIDEKLIYKPEDGIVELLWRRKYNTGFPTKLINRSLFDRLRFHEASRCDDIYLMPQIFG